MSVICWMFCVCKPSVPFVVAKSLMIFLGEPPKIQMLNYTETQDADSVRTKKIKQIQRIWIRSVKVWNSTGSTMQTAMCSASTLATSVSQPFLELFDDSFSGSIWGHTRKLLACLHHNDTCIVMVKTYLTGSCELESQRFFNFQESIIKGFYLHSNIIMPPQHSRVSHWCP